MILNLVVNAAQAIPAAGVVTIATQEEARGRGNGSGLEHVLSDDKKGGRRAHGSLPARPGG